MSFSCETKHHRAAGRDVCLCTSAQQPNVHTHHKFSRLPPFRTPVRTLFFSEGIEKLFSVRSEVFLFDHPLFHPRSRTQPKSSRKNFAFHGWKNCGKMRLRFLRSSCSSYNLLHSREKNIPSESFFR